MITRILPVAVIVCCAANAGPRTTVANPLTLNGFLPSCETGRQYTFVSDSLRAEFSGKTVNLRAPNGRMQFTYEGGQSGGWQAEQPEAIAVNLVRGGAPCSGLALSKTLSYRELYQGISVRFQASGETLKSEYQVEPGADPQRIRLRYQAKPRIEAGELLIEGADGIWKERPPVAWQPRGSEPGGSDPGGSKKDPVAAKWRVGADGSVGFVLADYDQRRPLIIDPAVSYSTYLTNASSFGFSAATATAVDSHGNVYVTGWIEGSTLGVSGTAAGSVDAFLMKLSPAGAIVFATYFGGSGDDRALGVAVDSLDQIWMTGVTSSSNLPVVQPFQPSLRGYRNAFIARFSADGALQFSSYYGGSGSDSGNGIAADALGNVYITGDTQSANLPLLQAAQNSLAGGQDAFVAKVSGTGSLVYSTYLGGSNNDHGAAIAVDSNGSAYVTGSTSSRDFPTKTPYQAAIKGAMDAFVAKLDPTGASLIYSTYLGGTGGTAITPEQGNAIAVDPYGNAFVAGVTSSTDFPIAGYALQKTLLGSANSFVTAVNAAGTGLTYSTYLGGSGQDSATGLIVDRFGAVCISGHTSSTDFPSESPVQASNAGSYDGFVAILNPTANGLYFSSVWGGSGIDAANAVAMDMNGNVYVAAQTSSVDFPLANQLARNHASGLAAALVKIATGDASMYIHRLNYGVFGKAPDPTSLASWTTALNQGTQSRTQAAYAFTQDAGYQTLGFNVAGAYLAVLGRNPDFGGFQFWMTLYRIGYLASQVCPVVTPANATDCAKTGLINDFIGSQEFQNTYGALSNLDFVTRVGYGNVLGRVPDPGGLAYWSSLLDRGILTRAQVLLNGFINGPEFRNRFGNQIAIQLAYAALLFRTPTSTELSNGTTALSFGVTLSSIIGGLISGPEFTSGL